MRYYRATEDGPNRIERLKNRSLVAFYEEQIKSIVKEVCETLEEAQDELFLYGFGRGAWLVRAIAGLLDTMQMPKSTSLKHFDRLYQSVLDVYKARKDDDNRNGPKIVEFLRSHTTRPPRIQFVGVLDTVKYTAEGHPHDISFVPSIRDLRHALALNESRAQLIPEIYENPPSKYMQGRSFVQAWFIGSHEDLGGGAREDGLSLYPLQWLLIESMRAGLILQKQDEKPQQVSIESPLSLAFPQYFGELPKLDGGEKIEWQVEHANGVRVSLFDLHSKQGNPSEMDQRHSIQIHAPNPLYNNPAKVFSSGGLIGWRSDGKYSYLVRPRWFDLLTVSRS